MPTYFEFEIALNDVAPRIWRRFLIRSTATFEDLHGAIQEACGWWDYHLFAFCTIPTFEPGNEIAGVPDQDGFEGDPEIPDARKIKLARVFGGGKTEHCYYVYDFGDDWWHEVILRSERKLPGTFKRQLLGGERAFPHEDCGGLSGYEDCVRAALRQDENLDDPEGLRRWMGSWHPESFEFKRVKEAFDS